jgi:hypothetical protein
MKSSSAAYRQTDGQTDRQADRQTDGRRKYAKQMNFSNIPLRLHPKGKTNRFIVYTFYENILWEILRKFGLSLNLAGKQTINFQEA